MQINGAHLSTVFAPKPIGLEQEKRAPITFDAEKLTIDEQSTSPVIKETQEERTVNDFQQSRFVRLFSTESEPSSNANQPSSLPLPKGVQQYLQVEQLNSNDDQQLLDESV